MNKLSAKGKLWKQCILVYCDRDVMYRLVLCSFFFLDLFERD